MKGKDAVTATKPTASQECKPIILEEKQSPKPSTSVNDVISTINQVPSTPSKKSEKNRRKRLRKQIRDAHKAEEDTEKPTNDEVKTEASNQDSKKQSKTKSSSKPVIVCVDFDLKTVSSDNIKFYSMYLEEHVNRITLTEEDHELHLKLKKELEIFLKDNISSKVVLDFFGSASNGFGCQGSDLDICVEGIMPHRRHEREDPIRKLAAVLRKHPQVNSKSVIAITAAKVPIVRFNASTIGRDGSIHSYECDISSGNDLAIENTVLFETYSKIDARVRLLGILVKYWAKACGICDASLGSLSSYAYIIMVLHFLQKRGVIPVLQELPPPGLDECPKHVIDGCDVYFFEEIDQLEDVWPQGFRPDRNRETLLELFLGFLKYYGEDFDLKSNVITCNTSRTVKRCDLKFTENPKKSFAIQDPFLLRRDLASNRHSSIFELIVDSMRSTYNHLVSRIKSLDHFNTAPFIEIDILFDRKIMCAGHENNTSFKYRCECGRLEPRRRPKHGNCECGLALPFKVNNHKRKKKNPKDVKLINGSLQKKDMPLKDKGVPAPRLNANMNSFLPTQKVVNVNKVNETSNCFRDSPPHNTQGGQSSRLAASSKTGWKDSNKKSISPKGGGPSNNINVSSQVTTPSAFSTHPCTQSPSKTRSPRNKKQGKAITPQSNPNDLWKQLSEAKASKNSSLSPSFIK